MNTVDNKRHIGLGGEMHLAMELHSRGWQVYRAYIDSHTDYILTRYWCEDCKKYAEPEKRFNPKGGSFPTDCCETCLKNKLRFVIRFVQVKTSEGVDTAQKGVKSYKFHANLRSNIDPRAFYAWVAMIPRKGILVPHYYIFHHEEINKFNNLDLSSFQKTDNQNIHLAIDKKGNVVTEGSKYDYNCFKKFHNNFKKLMKKRWPENS